MTLKRKIALAGGGIFFFILLLIGLSTAVYRFLPRYLESRMFPRLAAEAGISDIAVRVRGIGLFQADVGPVRIGPADTPALTIESVRIDYSPRDIIQKKIKCITVNGLALYMAVSDGGFRPRGIDFQKLAEDRRQRASRSAPGDEAKVGIFFERMDIRNSRAMIETEDQVIRVPLEMQITPRDAGMQTVNASARFYPRDQEIDLSATLDRIHRKAEVTIDAGALNPGLLKDIIGRIADVELTGELGMHTSVDVLWTPLRVSCRTASITLRRGRLAAGGLVFETAFPDRGEEIPLRIDLVQTGENQWRVSGDQVSMSSPMSLVIDGFNADIQKNESGFEGTGSFDKVVFRSQAEGVHIPKVVIKGRANLAQGSDTAPLMSFDLTAPDTAVNSKAAEIKIPEIAISGKLQRDEMRRIKSIGVIQFSGADGRLPGLDGRFNGALGKIPFEWPVEEKTETGSVRIAGLAYKKMDLGSVSATVWQTPTGFAFRGLHQSSVAQDVKVEFSGESGLFNAASGNLNLRLALAGTGADNSARIDFGKFLPAAEGLLLNAGVDLKGDLLLDDRGISGRLHAEIKGGRLTLSRHEFTLDGIELSLDFPELPRVRSGPGQQLRIDRFTLGGLTAENGSIDFQIESAVSLLLETLRFSWCGGTVETRSMRIFSDMKGYRTTFYCDRLNLAEVLGQFGAAAATGRGTVNGRIPVVYADGNIGFGDGFLFSTPGEGGKIQLSEADILTAGISPDSPQFIQLQLASEALKDYDYDWAKLNITSQDEDVLLKMQMDGTPANTLPFVYNKDIGGFVKVEADVQGSRFQGLRLDVNFRLPLNKLLQYKGLMKMMD